MLTDAQVDQVTLSSAADCTKEHAAEIVGGATLPAALASSPVATLVDTKSAVRSQLEAFAAETCSPAAVVKNVYPKQAAALAPLFAKDGVTDWTVPASGFLGWALPDAASYDAGTKALLCVFEPSTSAGSSTAGDIRRISTPTPVANRLCYDFTADNSASVHQSCAQTHDIEALMFLQMPLSGQPTDPNTWSPADWAPFDGACAQFGTAVVGAKRADFKFDSDTNPNQAPNNGTRVFTCRAYPTKDTAAIAANQILAGAGTAKIKLAKT